MQKQKLTDKNTEIFNNYIMYTINLHSLTDLITNSSTTIYTYSEGSVKPCKELINEVLALMGSEQKCDDIFNITVGPRTEDIVDRLRYELEDLLEPEEYEALGIPEDYSKASAKITKIVDDIQAGNIPKPEWYVELIEDADEESFQCDTVLHIEVLDPKFQKLAKKVVDFLGSIRAEEGYN